jgi:exosortase/archaeosortase family protein
LLFHLPGIVIEVAKECSGIHSSLVLFVTSLLAGHLFLRSPWKKATLALAVVPLGIARNGIRIFTISWLCVHVDPAMIDSPIHHRGGPIFFVLSLVPFLAFLFILRRLERPKNDPSGVMAGLPGKEPLS